MNIDKGFKPLTVISYHVSSKMDKIIREVLKSIPEKYSENFPAFSISEAPSLFGAHFERDNTKEARIIIDPLLLNHNKKVIVGIIAHQFAHVYLGHTELEGNLSKESKADALAGEWGFSIEITEMRLYLSLPIEPEQENFY